MPLLKSMWVLGTEILFQVDIWERLLKEHVNCEQRKYNRCSVYSWNHCWAFPCERNRGVEPSFFFLLTSATGIVRLAAISRSPNLWDSAFFFSLLGLTWPYGPRTAVSDANLERRKKNK